MHMHMLSPLRRPIDPADSSPSWRLCRALDWDRTPSRRLVRRCPTCIAAEYMAYAGDWAGFSRLYSRVPAAALHVLSIVAIDSHESGSTSQAQHIARAFLSSDAARRAVESLSTDDAKSQ